VSTCASACREAWPDLLIRGSPAAGRIVICVAEAVSTPGQRLYTYAIVPTVRATRWKALVDSSDLRRSDCLLQPYSGLGQVVLRAHGLEGRPRPLDGDSVAEPTPHLQASQRSLNCGRNLAPPACP
jgi:hypothetical protein